MQRDEQEIRDLVTRWMNASRAGDADAVLQMVTDDVVFLQPGRAPMRRPEFEAAQRAQAGAGAPRIDGNAEVQEVQVAGDWAFMWTRLSVDVTPADGSATIRRAGHTLTVLRKEDGRWRIARDANVLAPVTDR